MGHDDRRHQPGFVRRVGEALVLALALTVGARGQGDPKQISPIAALDAEANSPKKIDEARLADLVRAARAKAQQSEPSQRARLNAQIDGLVAIKYLNEGDWARAEQAYETAIRSSAALGAEDFGLVTDLAQVELRLEKPAEALALVRRVIDSGYESRAQPEDVVRLNGIAVDVFAECGLFDLALERLNTLEKLTEEGNMLDHLECAFRRIGIDYRTERFDKVVETARAVLAWPELESPYPQMLQVRLGLAQSELARGRADDGGATKTLEEALAGGDLDDGEVADAGLCLLDLALRSGDLDLATKRLAALDRRFEGIELPPMQACLRAAYATRLALDSHASRDELERHRAELAPAIEAVWQDWERGAGRAGGVGFLTLGTQRTVVSEAMCLEMTLDTTERGIDAALAVLLRAQRPGSLSRRLGESEPTLAEVRDWGCRDGTSLLILFPAAERSHVFEVNAARAWHLETGSRDKLLAASRRVDEITLRPPASEDRAERARAFDAAVSDLTGLLFDAPSRERSRAWKRLTVIGAELLSNTSVEFLEPEPGREVGLAVPVAYVSSMPLLIALERRADGRARKAFTSDLVIVADPVANGRTADAARLELSDETRSDLRSGFAKDRVVELYEADATLDAVTDDRVLGAGVLAVIAHGRFDSKSEIPIAVEMTRIPGRPNVLGGEAVARLTHAPRFVELYVCRAGSGPLRMGDDAATHLGTAFLAADSDAVLTSRGDLPVPVALEVARSMHLQLARGATASEAFLEARRTLAQKSQSSDPYYRSMLRVEGLGHRAVFAASVRAESTSEREAGGRTKLLIAASTVVAISVGLCLMFVRRRRSESSSE